MKHRRFILARLAIVFFAGQCAAQQKQPSEAFRRFVNLTSSQWAAIERGEIVTATLDTTASHEVAVLGVASVKTATSCFLEKVRDIENFKRSASVLQIRKVSLPFAGTLDDFALPPEDVADLQKCRVDDCSIKLPANILEKLSELAAGSDFTFNAQRVIREDLSDYVKEYLAKGNDALVQYRDKSKPMHLEQEFRSMLAAKPGLRDSVPELYTYLDQYRNMKLGGADEFIYWSIEKFGLKPVTSITHVTIYPQPEWTWIASKQVYGSHYFEASLGLTIAVDRLADAASPEMYLAYVNRSRIDLLGGFLGGLRRAVLRGRLREGLKTNLEDVRRRLETECGTHSVPSGKGDETRR